MPTVDPATTTASAVAATARPTVRLAAFIAVSSCLLAVEFGPPISRHDGTDASRPVAVTEATGTVSIREQWGVTSPEVRTGAGRRQRVREDARQECADTPYAE
jgi:hypothetical protein